MTIGGRTAYTQAPNPDCAVCEGSGADPVFDSDCTECWPPRSRLGNRINTRTGEIMPSRGHLAAVWARKALYVVLLLAWTAVVASWLALLVLLWVVLGLAAITGSPASSKAVKELDEWFNVRSWYWGRHRLRRSIR